MIGNLFRYKCYLIESSDREIRDLERAYRQTGDPATKKELIVAYARAGREDDISGLDNLLASIAPESIGHIISRLPLFIETTDGQHWYWHEILCADINYIKSIMPQEIMDALEGKPHLKAKIVISQIAQDPRMALRYLRQWIKDDQKGNVFIPWYSYRSDYDYLKQVYEVAKNNIADSPEFSLQYAELIKPEIGHAVPWSPSTKSGRKALITIRSDPVVYDAYLQIAASGSARPDTIRWLKMTIDSLRP